MKKLWQLFFFIVFVFSCSLLIAGQAHAQNIVGGYVFYDILNQNCIKDPGEPPAVGLSMLIVSYASTFLRTTTNEIGYYRFYDISSGIWTVTSDAVPSGYVLMPGSKTVEVPPNVAANFCLVPRAGTTSAPTPKPPSCALAGNSCQASIDCQDGSTACGIYSCVSGTCQSTVLTPTSTPKPTPTTPGTVTPTPTSNIPTPIVSCYAEGESCAGATPKTCCSNLVCNPSTFFCEKTPTGTITIDLAPTPVCANSPTNITVKKCSPSDTVALSIIKNSEITNPDTKTITANADGTAVLSGYKFPDPPSGAETGSGYVRAECSVGVAETSFSVSKCAATSTPTHAPPTP
ncbi:MAG: hypothetical protein HYT11_04230, partial [Candidatus Levybacteria bacterium]|nr:hypothetical protein [Candidatus Levybacteria bacterium]